MIMIIVIVIVFIVIVIVIIIIFIIVITTRIHPQKSTRPPVMDGEECAPLMGTPRLLMTLSKGLLVSQPQPENFTQAAVTEDADDADGDAFGGLEQMPRPGGSAAATRAAGKRQTAFGNVRGATAGPQGITINARTGGANRRSEPAPHYGAPSTTQATRCGGLSLLLVPVHHMWFFIQ
jgi:hypothetical protein